MDAVRRRFDAGPNQQPPSFKRKANPKPSLALRTAEAIYKNGNQYSRDHLDSDEYEILEAAVKAVRWNASSPKNIAMGFTLMLMETYEKHRADEISPGNLCSKVIDRCASEQKACKTTGADPSDYFWPPDFQEHRDRLRKEERASEQSFVEVRA